MSSYVASLHLGKSRISSYEITEGNVTHTLYKYSPSTLNLQQDLRHLKPTKNINTYANIHRKLLNGIFHFLLHVYNLEYYENTRYTIITINSKHGFCSFF